MTNVKRSVLSLKKPVIERLRCDLTINEIIQREHFPEGITLFVAKKRRARAFEQLCFPFLCWDPELLNWRYKWWTACVRYLYLKAKNHVVERP